MEMNSIVAASTQPPYLIKYTVCISTAGYNDFKNLALPGG
jgi:hypothetical protein